MCNVGQPPSDPRGQDRQLLLKPLRLKTQFAVDPFQVSFFVVFDSEPLDQYRVIPSLKLKELAS